MLIKVELLFKFRFGDEVKILHFLGDLKPWEFGYDPQTGEVSDPPDVRETTFQEHLKLWWKLFLNHVHKRLDRSMVIEKINSQCS